MDEDLENLSKLIHLSKMNMDTKEFLRNDVIVSTENKSLYVKDILKSVQGISDQIEEDIEEDIEEINESI